MGVITPLEFLQHFLTKLGHRNLLVPVTQLISTLSPSYLLKSEHALASAAQRLRPNRHLTHLTSNKAKRRVESRTGAGALVFRWLMARLSPALPQSGLAWLCFLFPLIEPNRRVSRIRLSEKVSRGRPRKAGRPGTKLDEPKLLMQSGFRIPFGRRPS